MAREFVIYADESEQEGRYYSNFYGGVLVESRDLGPIVDSLNARKADLNLHRELKWTRVTENYLEKYRAMVDLFFDFISEGKLRVRIMFTKNSHVPQDLTRAQRDNAYFLLYYQFLKHAFGLGELAVAQAVRCRIYLDELPDSREKASQFKAFVSSLDKNKVLRGKIRIDPDQIAEVDSSKHVVLQMLDVVLGAMHFRLNDKHKEKPEGAKHRGKRTVAKEKLYRHINGRIRQIHPNFNIGISTGQPNGRTDRLKQPYRHWLFKTSNSHHDKDLDKP